MQQRVFHGGLARLGESGLVCGRTLDAAASTLEANAAMRSLERWDTGQSYPDFLSELAKMKDGRTHLAYKNEHAIDLDTGALLAVTVQPAATGDTKSLPGTMEQAETNLVAIPEQAYAPEHPNSGIKEVAIDNGYHSDEILMKYAEQGIRTYINEPKQKRNWKGKEKQKRATQSNRRSIRGERGKELLRRQGELVERPFAHRMDRGRLRRLHVGGTSNVAKQELLLCAAQNRGQLMRAVYGAAPCGGKRRSGDPV